MYGGWYDYETLISHASKVLGDTLSLQAIADLLVNDVQRIMRLQAAALLLPEREHSYCVRQSQGFETLAPIRQEGALAKALQEIGKPVLQEALADRLRSTPAVQDELANKSNARVQVWVPLVQEGEMVGLLLLGGKQAGDFFYPRDTHMLTSLASKQPWPCAGCSWSRSSRPWPGR
jgi:GAF domain-containing protein